MFETKADYQETVPLIQRILRDNNRPNLANLLEQPRVKKLFLHEVDHPMGYFDGPSGVSTKKMKRRAYPLTEKDRHKLYQIAEYSLREVGSGDSSLDSKEKSNLLLGANQLVQSADWKYWHGTGGWRRKGTPFLEKLTGNYIEDESIARVPEWDAHIAENKSIFHVENSGGWQNASLGAQFATMVGAFAYSQITGNKELAEFISHAQIYGLVGGAGFGIWGNMAAQVLQDTSVDGSPNTTRKLITNRHYSLLRHPLYLMKMLGGVTPGVVSMNPIGFFTASKTAYHISKACEFQDERMRILHGDEAIDFQERVSAFIPGFNSVRRGLERILPESTTSWLRKPLSEYLEAIPKIRCEKYFQKELSNEPEYHKGEPTIHLGTEAELKTRDAAYMIGWRAVKHNAGIFKEMGEVFAELPRLVYNWASPKVKKKWKKYQRRKRYKESLKENSTLNQMQ